MFVNVFLLLLAYYILKTVREPLILTTGGAELKSYAAGAQAAVLLGYVPLYGWLVSRLSRNRLVDDRGARLRGVHRAVLRRGAPRHAPTSASPSTSGSASSA